MPNLLTAVAIVSWLVLFIGLFLYDRMDRRIARLVAVQEHLLRTQQALLSHLGVTVPEDELTSRLRSLIDEGKTYEAIVLCRSTRGVSHKEARAYVDLLHNEQLK